MNTYTEYLEIKNKQNSIVDELSDKLNSYPKGEFGLIEDRIRQSDEFKEVHNNFKKQFNILQNINKEGVKKFKKEIQANRYNFQKA